jgi:hypothetical protein
MIINYRIGELSCNSGHFPKGVQLGGVVSYYVIEKTYIFIIKRYVIPVINP